jgi:hypothetical protein
MIENRIKKIALLNIIFHCNLDSIYNLIIKIESNLNDELYDNIEIDNLFKLNKELDIKIIISNSHVCYIIVRDSRIICIYYSDFGKDCKS